MSLFLLNREKRTVTLHQRENCSDLPHSKTLVCGCSDPTLSGNQRLLCDQHFKIKKVKEFMEGGFWIMLPCEDCYQ